MKTKPKADLLKDLADAQAEIDKLTNCLLQQASQIAAQERELDRWRHDVPVEGDFVCPGDLRAYELEGRLKETQSKLDELKIILLTNGENLKHSDSCWCKKSF